MLMVVGEYVLVQIQVDIEDVDLVMEKCELCDNLYSELEELVVIYCYRGLEFVLVWQVVEQFIVYDVLGVYVCDELGIIDILCVCLLQVVLVLVGVFICGVVLLVLIVLFVLVDRVVLMIMVSILFGLCLIGVVVVRVGGVLLVCGVIWVMFWGVLVMVVVVGVGCLFGVYVL